MISNKTVFNDMRKSNVKYGFYIMSLMLNIFAFVFGGGVLMAADVTGGEYGGDTDPNAGTPLEGAVKTVPDDMGGLVQHGQDSSGSALQEAELIDNVFTKKVLERHAAKFPFFTGMFSKCAQFSWKGHKEGQFPEVGDIRLEAALASDYTTDKAHEVELPLHENDKLMFREGFTAFVMGQQGYDESGQPNNEFLMLIVTSNTTGSNPKFQAVNGPMNNRETYIPNLDGGTMLMLGAPALLEEDVEVDPLNIIPTPKDFYMQKKAYAVAVTDFFNEAVKTADWGKKRVKAYAWDAYRRMYTATALFGAKRKFYRRNKNGVRICYTQQGLIPQLRLAFELQNGQWSKKKLIALSKLLGALYPDSDVVDGYLGSDSMESLLNIDFGNDTTIIRTEKDDKINVKVKVFETPFCTLRFHHEPALTMYHLEKAAFFVNWDQCTRIYRENGKTITVDGKKGETGRVEELVKDYFLQDDCFLSNSMNSVLVGPSSLFATGLASGVKYNIADVNELPASPSDGDIVYLMEVDEDFVPGLYKYDAAAQEWKPWRGELDA